MGRVRELYPYEATHADQQEVIFQQLENEMYMEQEKENAVDKAMNLRSWLLKNEMAIEVAVGNVIEGELCPITSIIIINQMEKAIGRFKNAIKDQAMDESNKHGKTYNFQGFEIRNIDGRKSYDYSDCEEIVRLTQELKDKKKMYSIGRDSVDNGAYSDVHLMPDGKKVQVFLDNNSQLLVAPTIKYSAPSIQITKSKK